MCNRNKRKKGKEKQKKIFKETMAEIKVPHFDEKH